MKGEGGAFVHICASCFSEKDLARHRAFIDRIEDEGGPTKRRLRQRDIDGAEAEARELETAAAEAAATKTRRKRVSQG